MRRLIVVLALSLFPATACLAQQNPADQPATKADIERYFDTIQMRDLMKNMMEAKSQQMRQVFRQMVQNVMQKHPDFPSDFEARMNKMCDNMVDTEVKDLPPDELLDVMEPAYEKHLTKDEVESLIAFYSTPIGQKIRAEMPAITQEAMQASTAMMTKLAEHLEQEVEDQINQMINDSQSGAKKPTSTN